MVLLSSLSLFKPLYHYVYKFNSKHLLLLSLNLSLAPEDKGLTKGLLLPLSLHLPKRRCVLPHNSEPKLRFLSLLDQILPSNLQELQELYFQPLLGPIELSVWRLLLKRKLLLFCKNDFILWGRILIKEEYHKRLFLLQVHLNKKRVFPMPKLLFIELKVHYLKGEVLKETLLQLFVKFLCSMVFVQVLLWFKQI